MKIIGGYVKQCQISVCSFFLRRRATLIDLNGMYGVDSIDANHVFQLASQPAKHTHVFVANLASLWREISTFEIHVRKNKYWRPYIYTYPFFWKPDWRTKFLTGKPFFSAFITYTHQFLKRARDWIGYIYVNNVTTYMSKRVCARLLVHVT